MQLKKAGKIWSIKIYPRMMHVCERGEEGKRGERKGESNIIA